MVIPIPIYVVVFVFGLVFGSFFNVCIHRWPQEEKTDHEWIKTPSNCPKCRAAMAPISVTRATPTVEALTASRRPQNFSTTARAA